VALTATGWKPVLVPGPLFRFIISRHLHQHRRQLLTTLRQSGMRRTCRQHRLRLIHSSGSPVSGAIGRDAPALSIRQRVAFVLLVLL